MQRPLQGCSCLWSDEIRWNTSRLSLNWIQQFWHNVERLAFSFAGVKQCWGRSIGSQSDVKKARAEPNIWCRVRMHPFTDSKEYFLSSRGRTTFVEEKNHATLYLASSQYKWLARNGAVFGKRHSLWHNDDIVCILAGCGSIVTVHVADYLFYYSVDWFSNSVSKQGNMNFT